jgi:SAM-dependent methyltransferase
MNAARDAYDAVAYPSFAYPQTHPDRLAAMAILHGLSPAPVERCRVLEIACSEGANLIPMAYAIPGSEFVGFDIAGVPIERGQARIRELGLANIRLFESDLMELGAELGRFDYIIAHGLYAWVPESVADRLLALCRELLTPHGVAFISYSALPGNHLRSLMRDMMRFSAGRISDPEEKVSAALAFLRFVGNARPEGDTFRMLIEDQLEQAEKRSPYVLFHDELSDVRRPVLFSDFIAHARRHGLAYLCESTLPSLHDPAHIPDLQPVIESLAGDDVIAREQALDFLRMRMYRETLLCHGERQVRRDHAPEQLRRLSFASQATSAPGKTPGASVFTVPDGSEMETTQHAIIALVEQLEEAWPQTLSFAELEPRLSGAGFSLDRDGAELLVHLALAKLIQLHAWKAPVAATISGRPRASASARQEGRSHPYMTTLLHTAVRLDDPLVRSFLCLLDGTRDRAVLLDALRTEYPAIPAEKIAQGIEPILKRFHRAGALEA